LRFGKTKLTKTVKNRHQALESRHWHAQLATKQWATRGDYTSCMADLFMQTAVNTNLFATEWDDLVGYAQRHGTLYQWYSNLSLLGAPEIATA